MSSLNSMLLQGVRSFNPACPEKIKFETPVTIILGQNGSGKTTLIESLKFITTGDFPTGSKGAAFVHDPKINNSAEVKGQIKLDLQSVKGEKVTLTRSMLVTQKRTKAEFKTLESVVKVLPKNGGEPKVLPGKCGELENEAVTHLGVSKAVLNNVLFCHQEDSNWPLCESKALKLRFDDIFSIKKYMKAVENLKAIAKNEETNIKVMREQKISLEEIKLDAEKKRKSFEEIEEEIRIGENKIKEIREKLIPMEEQLKKFEETTKKLNALKIEHGTANGQKNSVQNSIQNLRKHIKDIYDGTDEDLKADLEDFEGLCRKKEKEKFELEEQKKKAEDKISSMNLKKNQLSTKQGELETEVKYNKKRMEERQMLVQQIATELKLSGFAKNDLSETQIGQFLEEMVKIHKKLEKSLSETKMDFKEKESDIASKMNEIVRKKAAYEEEARLKEKLCKDNEKEIKDLKEKLTKIDASQKRLIFLDQEIQKTEKSLIDARRDVDEEVLKKEISSLKFEKSDLELKLGQAKNELKEAQNTNDLRINLDQWNKNKADKDKQLDKFLDTHRDSLEQFFPNVAVENLRATVEQFMVKKSKEVTEMEKLLKEKQMKGNELDIKRKNLQEKLEEKNKELTDCDENILQTSGGDENYDEQLQSLSENLDQLHKKKGTIDGAQYVYDGFIRNLKVKSCCPLCLRNFETENESKRLINDLNEKLNRLPAEQEQLHGTIKDKEFKQQELIKLQPTVELAKKIREQELPSLKNEKDKITNKFRAIQVEISQKSGQLKEEEKSVMKIAADVSLIDSLQTEIKNLETTIEKIKRELNTDAFDTDRSLADIKELVENLERHREILSKDIEKKQEKLELCRQRVHKLNDEFNKLTKERLEINENMQKRLTIAASIEKLTNDIVVARQEAEAARLKLSPLDENYGEMEEKKNKLTKEKDQHVDEINKKISQVEQKRMNVESLTKSIKNFEAEGKMKNLTNCLNEIQQMDKEITRRSSELILFDQKLKEINSDLDGQEAKRRELHDNLELRRLESETRSYEKRIEELSSKIARLESTGLGVDTKKFHENYVDLKNKCAKSEGSLEEMVKNRKLLKAELDSDKYKNAAVRFRDKLIDLTATEIAVDDVRKYYSALESCLIKYHETKMKDINDMIKQLWQEVYKGGDIDYVQIKAESESSSIDKRRTAYNYRVVMYVNDHELDMRGRCSAGQKVLASILIRIALAEVFCTNCGVLALDEPTTNLDSTNIESLAEALAKIIDRRSQQKNFQLVLITHDQQFVRLLIQQHPVDYYYRVAKDENGFSRLEKESAMNILND